MIGSASSPTTMSAEDRPVARRARLHVAIADRLETAFGERAGELAAELASHFELGGDVVRAILYHHAAGDNAGARSAAREAIEHYRRALHLLAGLPDSDERAQREITGVLSAVTGRDG